MLDSIHQTWGQLLCLNLQSTNKRQLGVVVCTHIASFLPSINLEGYSLVKKYIEAIPLPKKEDMVNDYLVQLNNIKHVAKKGTKEVVSSIGKLNKLSQIENRHRSDREQKNMISCS
mgnify:CR=1 FL=1